MTDWAIALTPPRWRRWLLAETPHSRLQARLSRAYLGWVAFARNPLAMLGLRHRHRPDRPGGVRAAGRAAQPADRRRSRPAPAAARRRALARHRQQGRDIWSRIVYGSRTTLLIIFMVAITAAPHRHRRSAPPPAISAAGSKRVLMRLTDAFLAFPKLVLALAFAAALGPGIENAVLAIALTAWPPYARIARAETLTVRSTDYVAAARISGASGLRILHRPHHADVHAVADRARLARHGRRDPDRGRPRLPRPRRRAAAAGMGRHGVGRPQPDPGAMVGLHLSRHRHLHRQPRLQPDRRRVARRARSAGRADDG